MEKIEGVYAAYMTGTEGQGFALVLFMDGIITGADPLGVLFDGWYKISKKESSYSVSVNVKVPKGGTVIQGVTAKDSDIAYDVLLTLPRKFWELDYIPVTTPLGPINMKLKKIRDLRSAST